MTEPPDFEFHLGKTRCLKGRGWRGLIALGLLLVGLVACVQGAAPIARPIGRLVGF
ncbi:hypothetical protein QBC99_003218 [Beijerinckia sp. GAS462]|nr:hypothetical protein [Beijerinckia sp. GAS462]SEC74381.1 hypothetical protein SAMN05443249_3447 [Beijerinckia sp. 28-YEA-48]